MARFVAVVALVWAVFLLLLGTLIAVGVGMTCEDECPPVGVAFWFNVAGQVAAIGLGLWALVAPQHPWALIAAIGVATGAIALTGAIMWMA